jgi:hypothetical protein
MQGERMDTSGKLRSEHLIYHAVAIDPALPFECPRYDIQSEMSFAARTVARMAGVAM